MLPFSYYLKQKSGPEITFETLESNGNLMFDTVLTPHDVVLLEIMDAKY